MQATPSKVISKNQFKCFHCRAIFEKKLGDWFDWGHMQVHLCRPCDSTTKGSKERAK